MCFWHIYNLLHLAVLWLHTHIAHSGVLTLLTQQSDFMFSLFMRANNTNSQIHSNRHGKRDRTTNAVNVDAIIAVVSPSTTSA